MVINIFNGPIVLHGMEMFKLISSVPIVVHLDIFLSILLLELLFE